MSFFRAMVFISIPLCAELGIRIQHTCSQFLSIPFLCVQILVFKTFLTDFFVIFIPLCAESGIQNRFDPFFVISISLCAERGNLYEFRVAAINKVDPGVEAVKHIRTPDGVPTGGFAFRVLYLSVCIIFCLTFSEYAAVGDIGLMTLFTLLPTL